MMFGFFRATASIGWSWWGRQVELRATVLPPAALIAEIAVEQPNKMIKNGETGQPEGNRSTAS